MPTGSKPQQPRFRGAPKGALRELDAAARNDWSVLRLTLPFLRSLTGSGPSPVFPGIHWAATNVSHFPRALNRAVSALLDWARNPTPVLNDVLVTSQDLERYAFQQRASWPIAEERRKYIAHLREQPWSNAEETQVQRADERTTTVPILNSFRGAPLTPRVMTILQGLRPVSIQIANANEPAPWPNKKGVISVRLLTDGFSIDSIEQTISYTLAAEAPSRVEGELDDFFETGSEGLVWAIEDEVHLDRDALHFIEEGDHLTICDQSGRVLWSGIVDPDRETGFRRYPMNPDYGQPQALGYWIHWTQRGFEPDQWARFFVRGKADRLRGVLVRKNASSESPEQ